MFYSTTILGTYGAAKTLPTWQGKTIIWSFTFALQSGLNVNFDLNSAKSSARSRVLWFLWFWKYSVSWDRVIGWDFSLSCFYCQDLCKRLYLKDHSLCLTMFIWTISRSKYNCSWVVFGWRYNSLHDKTPSKDGERTEWKQVVIRGVMYFSKYLPTLEIYFW